MAPLQGADPARLSLIDKALEQLRQSAEGRPRGRRPGRIASRAGPGKKASPAIGQRAPARSSTAAGRSRRSSGRSPSWSAARASRPTIPGMWARPERRRILPLGGEGLDDDRRCRPTRSTSSASTRCARCTRRWTRSCASIGYTKGGVGARMQALQKDPRYRFADNDKGRAEVMAFIQERLAIIRAKMPQAFNTLVRGNVEVRRLPPEEEPGAPGAYGGAGSIDGTIPGKFWINLQARLRAYPLRPAEPDPPRGDPGPRLAGRICQQAAADPDLAVVQRLFGRLGALCRAARRRARRLRRLRSRPARLSQVDRLPRRRLVVDTGLHHKRWTREQARAIFPRQRSAIPNASEVDRYASWPGQALGYEVGHQEINRQRDKRAGGARRRASTSRRSTTRSCSAATCRWTCWPRTSTPISPERAPSA